MRKIFILSPEDTKRLVDASTQAVNTRVIYTPGAGQKPEDVRSWAEIARESVMQIWREMGAKYGFKWDTAEDSGQGFDHVSAEEL